MYQILDLLRANNLFCIRYNLEEGCTNNNCIKKFESNNFLNPYIVFKEDDIINNQTIISKFNSLLENELSTCKKCGYNKKGEILPNSLPSYYRLINDRHLPKIFFVIFDLLNYDDKGTEEDLEFLEFQRRKQYNNQLLNILKEEIVYENTKYNLKSLIFTPQSDHFTTILINYQNEKLNLKKGVNYYYNGDSKNHCLEEVNNINLILNVNVIYLGVYIEESDH